ncbi:MAG TPA: pyridoxamine 5'-phosphate oxidase family protein [Vicinamibacterales bacterium]|nr:pyridoxamine 5'-phosphate oxidase family protein [Vicinamibacterales bacterium]
MIKPEAVPTGAALRELALQTIKDAKFPVVASMDGDQPRLRPVSPVRTDGFTIYVASLRSSNKTGELENNPKVELCYLAENHDQVRITGIAERVTDRAVLQDIWDGDPLLRRFLGTIDNPEFILYKMIPNRVRFMREWALDYYEVTV